MEILFLILLFAFIGYYLTFMYKPPAALHLADADLRKKYRFNIQPESEKSVKIEKLVIYPCRGVQGI